MLGESLSSSELSEEESESNTSAEEESSSAKKKARNKKSKGKIMSKKSRSRPLKRRRLTRSCSLAKSGTKESSSSDENNTRESSSSDEPESRSSSPHKKKEDGGRLYNKKYYCLFCFKPFSKMAHHLESKHKDMPEVARALAFPKGYKERRLQRSLKGWLTCFFLGLIVFMGCSLACVHACFFCFVYFSHNLPLFHTSLSLL